MTDHRQNRSDRFKHQLDERGNPHGGRGRRAENNIAEQFETQTGHPLGANAGNDRGDERGEDRSGNRGGLSADLPRNTDLTRDQHARKGQAQSPRELNLNQPEKKVQGHGRHRHG